MICSIIEFEGDSGNAEKLSTVETAMWERPRAALYGPVELEMHSVFRVTAKPMKRGLDRCMSLSVGRVIRLDVAIVLLVVLLPRRSGAYNIGSLQSIRASPSKYSTRKKRPVVGIHPQTAGIQSSCRRYQRPSQIPCGSLAPQARTTAKATVVCRKKRASTSIHTSAPSANNGSVRGVFRQRYVCHIRDVFPLLLLTLRKAIKRHADLGYMAVSVYPLAVEYLTSRRLPAGIKAREWDGFHDLIVIDEIARCGYLGVIWALTCGNSIGAPPLVNFGTDEQKRRFLPGILDGTSRFCLGVTEPDGAFLLLVSRVTGKMADSVDNQRARM